MLQLVHFSVLAALLWTKATVRAHTWIDCIDTDRSTVYDNAKKWIYGGSETNGICDGYMKNYVGRGDPDVNTKMTFKILMHDVIMGAPVCTSDAADYSGWRHRIKVTPGEEFYYAYMDNGHTSKDGAGRGTYYGVYWTGQPETSLELTTDLTDDKLIDGQLHDFDDGNCGQTYVDGDFTGNVLTGRAGNDYPCVGNLKIPEGTAPGIYNLIWFWKFYNDKINANIVTTGGSYGGAAYSSCFQVEVVGAEGDSGNSNPATDSASKEAASTEASTSREELEQESSASSAEAEASNSPVSTETTSTPTKQTHGSSLSDNSFTQDGTETMATSDSSEEGTPVSIETPAPTETPVPTETPGPTETTETPVPTETQAPTETTLVPSAVPEAEDNLNVASSQPTITSPPTSNALCDVAKDEKKNLRRQ